MKKHSEDLWDFRSDSDIDNKTETEDIAESTPSSVINSADSVAQDETSTATESATESPSESVPKKDIQDETSSNADHNTDKTSDSITKGALSEEEMSKRQTDSIEGADFIIAHRHRSRHSHHHSHHSHHHSSHSHSSSSVLPEDNVDDYVYAHYRKTRSSHHHSSRTEYIRNHENEDTPVVRSTTESIRDNRKKDRKWKNRPWWQKLLIILAWITGILLLLLLIAFIVFLILSRIGTKDLTSTKNMNMTAPSIQSVDVQLADNGKTVVYDGRTYRYNDDIASILCIGVDKTNLNDNYDVDRPMSSAGQSDALYLIALDTDSGKTTVFSIPRDTMADIGVFDSNGKYIKTERLQICQAYAYGDGRETSCHNTVNAVSRLFYQLPIQTYFAMDLSAIAPINDTVGGVTVTMMDDSFYDINLVHHFTGETLTLYGDNARKYVQHRDVDKLESTTNRLSRQISYLKSFTSKAISMTKKDISTPISLYNVISSNSVTNLSTSKLSALAKCIIENGVEELDFVTVPGELTAGDIYAEYLVNEKNLYEMILNIYYTPVS